MYVLPMHACMRGAVRVCALTRLDAALGQACDLTFASADVRPRWGREGRWYYDRCGFIMRDLS